MYIFKSTINTRPIMENGIKYIRSDVPCEISNEEICRLLSDNVTTVIDLRSDAEREKRRCPLIDDGRLSYHIFAVNGADAVPQSADEVSCSYINMVDARFDGLIEFLLNVKTNVLIFCNAGKDRTGVVCAALLYKLGKPREYIIDDYMKSKENLAQMLNEFCEQNPQVDKEVVTPKRRYIEEFLDWYSAR